VAEHRDRAELHATWDASDADHLDAVRGPACRDEQNAEVRKAGRDAADPDRGADRDEAVQHGAVHLAWGLRGRASPDRETEDAAAVPNGPPDRRAAEPRAALLADRRFPVRLLVGLADAERGAGRRQAADELARRVWADQARLPDVAAEQSAHPDGRPAAHLVATGARRRGAPVRWAAGKAAADADRKEFDPASAPMTGSV
jgi:hypothetical protein